MMLPLLLSLVVAATDDPPVKVWLNHDNYFRRGDKARVNVKLADDGYLLVLRADAEGRVRVLFPLDPSNDNFVRGHETIEVRGRGDREAFFVDDREGSGLVLAARSTAPFKFDEFVRGDHWDYRVLDARQAGDDKEAALLDMVQRMTTEGRFDYDAVTYVVTWRGRTTTRTIPIMRPWASATAGRTAIATGPSTAPATIRSFTIRSCATIRSSTGPTASASGTAFTGTGIGRTTTAAATDSPTARATCSSTGCARAPASR